MMRWALAFLAVVLVAGLAFGLWWITSPQLPEGDRVGFGLLVGLFGLLSGSVAYGLGIWAGRDGEREAGRRATEELRARRERMEAQLAARRAERDQILAGGAQNPRLAGDSPRLAGGPDDDATRRGREILAQATARGGRSWHRDELHER